MKSVVWTGDVATTIAIEDGGLITGTTQDCVPYAERSKEQHKTGQFGSKDMRLAGSFPFVLIEKYCNDAGIEFSEWIHDPVHAKRMLADQALLDFRVWPGKV